jgi:DNA (cytosine-5)-methyltransferase 1
VTALMSDLIVDLFAGPGGWDEGLALTDLHPDVIGVELDKDACVTARAAGHERIQGDIRALSAADTGVPSGLIASPPCQTFSQAGLGEGRNSLSELVGAAALVLAGATPEDAAIHEGLDTGDPRSTLVLEPLRWVRDCEPRWLAFENVKGVLPVWQGFATLLRHLGYTAWAGTLNAADFGVPQSRTRAFLLASRGPLPLPAPTHSEHGGFDPQWVTMAEALGWPLDRKPNDDSAWAWERPATTVVRSFCPDVIAAPGWREAGDGPRQNTPGSIRVTEEQMCILQGIRVDYPFTASKTKRLSLIGAVLPPPWARAILSPLITAERVLA